LGVKFSGLLHGADYHCHLELTSEKSCFSLETSALAYSVACVLSHRRYALL
jgi:hypothetical protein